MAFPPPPSLFAAATQAIEYLSSRVPTVRHLSSKFAHEWDLSERELTSLNILGSS